MPIEIGIIYSLKYEKVYLEIQLLSEVTPM